VAVPHPSTEIARRHGTAVALRPTTALVPRFPRPLTVVVDEGQLLLSRPLGQDLARQIDQLLRLGRKNTRPKPLRRLPRQVTTVEQLGR